MSTVSVRVQNRVLRLSNLDKVLYPAVGFTKGEVLDYYSRIAPVLLPHVAGRPVTLRRYPDGVEATPFYDKDAARHAPSWLRVVDVAVPGSTMDRTQVGFAVLDDLPSLMWAANLAGIELHVPQWRFGPRGGRREPDTLVFDLDPGAPATIVDCARVALAVRDALGADGLTAYPKTSGSKGMQVCAPITVSDPERPAQYAHEVGTRVAATMPDVLVDMTRRLRRGKVFVDWSQNAPTKTTVAPYSLRGRERPTVSTPVSWDEVESCGDPADLVFTADDVLDRVARCGDLFAGALSGHQPLPRRR